MKKTIRVIALAALAAAPTLAFAQKSSSVQFGVSGGLSVPTGNLSDGVDAGYQVAGQMWVWSSPTIGFRGDVSYDNWKAKIGNVNLRSLAAVANIVAHPESMAKSAVAPYFVGGVGAFNTKAYTSSTSSSSNTRTNLGVQFGAGLEFRLSGFSTFAEAKFVNVFSSGNNTNWIPITFGVRF